MLKKLTCFILCLVISVSLTPTIVSAKDQKLNYTEGERELIYLKYTNQEPMLKALFEDTSTVGYWKMIEQIDEDKALSWSLDMSSKLIGELPDKKDYAEILANLIAMQEGDFAEQIETQSRFDDLKNGVDYVGDIVDIADSFIGGSKILEDISPIISAAMDGKDTLVENIEEAKYYETTIQSYVQANRFLDAVKKYARNKELREVAKELLKTNDTLLEKRLEYLGNTAGTIASYDAEFFMKELSFSLLKETDLYKTDDTVKWFVDCGSALVSSILSTLEAGKFAFRMVMLAGDLGFGTSDTFNRYQEMRVVADIANAIVKANHKVQTPSNYNSLEALANIQMKCDYYKMLLVNHARGEYLIYQLLVKDAGALSDITVLSDIFKNPGETTESWYNGQVDVMTRYFNILNNMFNVKEDVDILTDMNSHQELEEPIRTTSDERDIVLVLDTSGSMSGTPLEETKKASVKFVNTILEEDASIGVVTYDDKAEQLSDFSVNKNHLRQIVTGISDGGGTNIGDGLARAKSMLDKSQAKKKMIVLMSDGEPNQGKEGEELIAYANELKNSGIYVYTLGFFEDMGDKKSSAQYLMEKIASGGCHYEVANADDLVFFFEDIADQINGQKYIYVRIACPVDVSVTYKGETLNSSEKNPTLRTKFGTLTFEENQSTYSQGKEDKVKVLRLKEGAYYDIQIEGTGHGVMDYTIGFMDENGEYSDFRKFENIKITKRTMIDTVAADSDESVLKIDEDGDGKYDLKLSAEENGYGKEVKTRTWIYIVIGSGVLLLIIDLFIILKMRKKRKAR